MHSASHCRPIDLIKTSAHITSIVNINNSNNQHKSFINHTSFCVLGNESFIGPLVENRKKLLEKRAILDKDEYST